jgi:hypothetical protein
MLNKIEVWVSEKVDRYLPDEDTIYYKGEYNVLSSYQNLEVY